VAPLKSEFLLDPEIAYLNHGSFGACPRPVFEAYQSYQRELEREPVDFLQRTFRARMRAARECLAGFLQCDSDNLAFVRNATYGMNLAARSLPLGPGDTVLITDQEYGAVDRMWRTICAETGATLVRAAIPLPASSPEAIVEAVARHLDPSVRVLSFSHLSSESAHLFPIKPLLALAAEAGAISVVDGAHAPGQVPVDLRALGPDFYVGNCHKWMLAPKGAAFVFAADQWVDRIRPPVVSWGTISEGTSALLLENEWQGTIDISSLLAVADAIKFHEQHRWFEQVVPRCTRLIEEATPALLAVTGQDSLYACPELRPPQLATFRLPPGDRSTLHSELYHRHKVEIPIVGKADQFYFRVSVQAYNEAADLQRLADALADLL
jgi:isopenicillin-N epimerase